MEQAVWWCEVNEPSLWSWVSWAYWHRRESKRRGRRGGRSREQKPGNNSVEGSLVGALHLGEGLLLQSRRSPSRASDPFGGGPGRRHYWAGSSWIRVWETRRIWWRRNRESGDRGRSENGEGNRRGWGQEWTETTSSSSLRRGSHATGSGRSRLGGEEIWLGKMERGLSPRSLFWRAFCQVVGDQISQSFLSISHTLMEPDFAIYSILHILHISLSTNLPYCTLDTD